MRRRYIFLIVIICVLVSLTMMVLTLGAHSGVTPAQIAESLPGDDIIPDPWSSVDRAATMPANASTTWPWVEQLGKDRGGWYAPLWIENALHDYAASTTLPQYQDLEVGDIVPDWGGGSLKVLAIQPYHYIVYCSLHAPASTEIAASSTITNNDCAFTWTLVLENDTPSSTSFHLRLRMRIPTGTSAKYTPAALPGFADYLTDVVMFAGLTEQLRS